MFLKRKDNPRSYVTGNIIQQNPKPQTLTHQVLTKQSPRNLHHW